MWIWLRTRFARKNSAQQPSDLQAMQEALKPTKTRLDPPKPLTQPPKIEKRAK